MNPGWRQCWVESMLILVEGRGGQKYLDRCQHKLFVGGLGWTELDGIVDKARHECNYAVSQTDLVTSPPRYIPLLSFGHWLKMYVLNTVKQTWNTFGVCHITKMCLLQLNTIYATNMMIMMHFPWHLQVYSQNFWVCFSCIIEYSQHFYAVLYVCTVEILQCSLTNLWVYKVRISGYFVFLKIF